MRFSVSYQVNKLEKAYRMRVYSLIKEAVRTVNKPYYNKLFLQFEKRIKPFSFSTYLHNFTLDDTTITLDRITITISSPDMEFAVHAFNGLRKLKEYSVNGEVWRQSNFQLLKEPVITSRKVVFRTCSPILIEDKNGRPLAPTDPLYEKELNYYANLQIHQFAGRDLYEPIHISPIHMKKMVIKERNRHLEKNSFLYFTTYRGLFMLEGSPQDLQLLYQLGIGKRTTYFGLVEYEYEKV